MCKINGGSFLASYNVYHNLSCMILDHMFFWIHFDRTVSWIIFNEQSISGLDKPDIFA